MSVKSAAVLSLTRTATMVSTLSWGLMIASVTQAPSVGPEQCCEQSGSLLCRREPDHHVRPHRPDARKERVRLRSNSHWIGTLFQNHDHPHYRHRCHIPHPDAMFRQRNPHQCRRCIVRHQDLLELHLVLPPPRHPGTECRHGYRCPIVIRRQMLFLLTEYP